MPIFAFANAGITLVNISPLMLFKNSISLGVFLGLVFGKPLGIMLVSWLTVFSGLASKPKDLKWRSLIGVSFLAGIGFTMAMFITNLSLIHKDEEMAKLAILTGSTVAGIVGYLILKTSMLKSAKKA